MITDPFRFAIYLEIAEDALSRDEFCESIASTYGEAALPEARIIYDDWAEHAAQQKLFTFDAYTAKRRPTERIGAPAPKRQPPPSLPHSEEPPPAKYLRTEKFTPHRLNTKSASLSFAKTSFGFAANVAVHLLAIGLLGFSANSLEQLTGVHAGIIFAVTLFLYFAVPYGEHPATVLMLVGIIYGLWSLIFG